jgi:hypothetical protein
MLNTASKITSNARKASKMTSPESGNVPANDEAVESQEEVLGPATPGAEVLGPSSGAVEDDSNADG